MDTDSKRYKLILIIILLTGFALRIHELGRSSFWSDEAGQVIAAIQVELGDMLVIIKTHAMAMPLDYVITRLVSRLGVSEFILRFASVVWGTLVLPVFFVFARRLTRISTAVLAVLLLSLSVFHINYSQELRFYAALMFFYLLSSYLLLNCLRQPTKLKWSIYVVVTVIGSYFHPYVLLSVITGFSYLVITNSTFKKSTPLVIVSAILILSFLPGYLVFGASDSFTYELLRSNSSIAGVIMAAFGWVPLQIWGWSGLSIVLFMIGLLSVMSSPRQHRLLISVLLSTAVQIVLIVIADSIKGYWFFKRQLVHLAIVPMILVAVGATTLSEHVGTAFDKMFVKLHVRNRSMPSSTLLFFVVLVLVICLFTAPKIRWYYNSPRANGNEIVNWLLEENRSGAEIYVIPGHESVVYQYYLWRAKNSGEMVKNLIPMTWQQLSDGSYVIKDRHSYLVAPAQITTEQSRLLHLNGFIVLHEPEKVGGQSRIIYRRGEHIVRKR